jgi:N-terminal domain of anti-restriction factor ArdC
MATPEHPEFQPEPPATSEQTRSQPEILARLEQAISEIHDSDSFHRYLDIQSRFHRYSFSNTLLILVQRPDATQVAGFHAWRKLGRFVMKGEKGIRIVVPHVRKVETDDDDAKRRVTGFGVGTIFDVSQTTGEPLPTVAVPVLEGAEGSELYDRLTGLVAQEGLSLERRPAEAMQRDVMGFYSPKERSIVVREAAPLQMAKTLCHELAHHFSGRLDTREESETIAEATAYVVCAHHGLDSGERSFPYVATWCQDPVVFKQVLGTVQRVSAQIIEKLDQLPPAASASEMPPTPATPVPQVLYSAPSHLQPEPAPPSTPLPPEGTQFRLL